MKPFVSEPTFVETNPGWNPPTGVWQVRFFDGAFLEITKFRDEGQARTFVETKQAMGYEVKA